MNRMAVFNNHKIRFAVFLTVILICWILGRFFNLDAEYYKALLLKFPAFSGIVFVWLYVGVTFFIWPAKDFFKIIGAVFFGAYLSTLFIWAAELANAVLLFYLSRKLGRNFVEAKTKGKWLKLDERLGNLRFWDLFALRAVILIPYRCLDLACGLTKIPFKKYFMAVVFGSPLRIFFLQFFLALLGESFLRNIGALADFLHTHNFVSLACVIYIFSSVILIFRLKKIIGG